MLGALSLSFLDVLIKTGLSLQILLHCSMICSPVKGFFLISVLKGSFNVEAEVVVAAGECRSAGLYWHSGAHLLFLKGTRDWDTVSTRQTLSVKLSNDMEQCLDVWSCEAAIVSSFLRDVRMLVCFNWMTRDPNSLGNLTQRLCPTSRKPLLWMFQAIHFWYVHWYQWTDIVFL